VDRVSAHSHPIPHRFRNKFSVLLGWAYAYIHSNPEARIIVYPPGYMVPPKG
jgi:hypothetical protein